MNVVSIGECMLEISGERIFTGAAPFAAQISYGGDTLNTAMYMARLGSNSAFVTAVGADVASQWMVSDWQRGGVDTRYVAVDPERPSGSYLITTDSTGERSFLYWRKDSAASHFIDSDEKLHALTETLRGAGWVYFSGITLGILDDASRGRFFSLLDALRAHGVKIAFDGNYRPKLWRSVDEAQHAFEAACRVANLCLPTLDDEQILFGDADRDAAIERLLSYGLPEIVLKLGAQGCYVVTNDERTMVPGVKVSVVDTTSAGDSFNAAYLHHRIIGESPAESARCGNILAATVIQHRGAMIPVEKMPNLERESS